MLAKNLGIGDLERLGPIIEHLLESGRLTEVVGNKDFRGGRLAIEQPVSNFYRYREVAMPRMPLRPGTGTPFSRSL